VAVSIQKTNKKQAWLAYLSRPRHAGMTAFEDTANNKLSRFIKKANKKEKEKRKNV
jgi:hypothetical protein